MLGALKNLVKLVTSVIGLVITLVTSLVDLITKIPLYISMLFDLINYLPVQFKAFALVFVSTSFVMFILGRNKGGND